MFALLKRKKKILAFPCMQRKTKEIIFKPGNRGGLNGSALESLAVVLRGPCNFSRLLHTALPREFYSPPKGLLFLYRSSSQDSSWSVPWAPSPVSSNCKIFTVYIFNSYAHKTFTVYSNSFSQTNLNYFLR